MKRELSPEDRDMIIQSVIAGERVEATSIYISITGCGLMEAQEYIHELTEEMKATHPKMFARKRRNLFGS